MSELLSLLEELPAEKIDELYKLIFREENGLPYSTAFAKGRELAKRIKAKYRHIFNIFAGEMEPDWREICIATAKQIDIKTNFENLSTDQIEFLVVDKLIRKAIEKREDKGEELFNKLIEEVSNEIRDEVKRREVIKHLEDLGQKVGYAAAITSLLATVSFGKSIKLSTLSVNPILTIIGANVTIVGPIMSSVASILGWNVLQAIIFKSIVSMFGLWAGIKAAAGYGIGGLLMSISSTSVLGPASAILAAIFVFWKLGDTAWRFVIPAVLYIGVTRIEYRSRSLIAGTN